MDCSSNPLSASDRLSSISDQDVLGPGCGTVPLVSLWSKLKGNLSITSEAFFDVRLFMAFSIIVFSRSTRSPIDVDKNKNKFKYLCLNLEKRKKN